MRSKLIGGTLFVIGFSIYAALVEPKWRALVMLAIDSPLIVLLFIPRKPK